MSCIKPKIFKKKETIVIIKKPNGMNSRIKSPLKMVVISYVTKIQNRSEQFVKDYTKGLKSIE